MFLAMNEASKEQDSQEMNNEGMDMLLSQYYRQGRSLIEDYRSCQRAQRPPLSPPPTPPETQQQQTHAPGRTHSHRVQKSKPPRRAQVSPRELRRLKRKAPRRPVTRSMDQGRFHQVELDPRRGKVRYWGNKWESTSAWSYHAVSYSDFLERWVRRPHLAHSFQSQQLTRLCLLLGRRSITSDGQAYPLTSDL